MKSSPPKFWGYGFSGDKFACEDDAPVNFSEVPPCNCTVADILFFSEIITPFDLKSGTLRARVVTREVPACLFAAQHGIHYMNMCQSGRKVYKMNAYWDRETMTARDVTGFCAFSPLRNWAIFSTFWGDFLTTLHIQPGEKGKIHCGEVKKIQWRWHPEIADFCPLSWSNAP